MKYDSSQRRRKPSNVHHNVRRKIKDQLILLLSCLVNIIKATITSSAARILPWSSQAWTYQKNLFVQSFEGFENIGTHPLYVSKEDPSVNAKTRNLADKNSGAKI
jgi:hypothetical protein